MLIEMDCFASGRGVQYASTAWQNVAASTSATFTTKAKAEAFYIIVSRNDGMTMIYTNVNPTTGEIDNTTCYRTYTKGQSDTVVWTNLGIIFTVTDNSITTNYQLAGANASKQMVIYTHY